MFMHLTDAFCIHAFTGTWNVLLFVTGKTCYAIKDIGYGDTNIDKHNHKLKRAGGSAAISLLGYHRILFLN